MTALCRQGRPAADDGTRIHRAALRKPALRLCAAGLLATLTPVLAGGCGPGTPGRASGMPTIRDPALAAEIVGAFLPATGPQNSVGTQFVATITRLQNDNVAECMHRFGFGWRVQPYVRYDEKYVNQLSPAVPGWDGANYSGVPNLYDIQLLSRGGLLDEILTGSPNPPNLPASEARAIDADYSRCQVQAARLLKSLGDDGAAVGRMWIRNVVVIQASPQVLAAMRGFGTCVEGQGAPPGAARSLDAFSAWLSSSVQPSADPAAVRTPIAVRVANDRRWTNVFVNCARHVLALTGRLQLRAQEAFIRAHWRQIRALQVMASGIGSRLEHR